jgi:pilus assembly protein CpaF
LETGRITIARAAHRASFPARFQLVAAMNPCPCGWRGDSRRACRCTPEQVARYQGRISGPLLDRIDLQVEVPALAPQELLGSTPGETSTTVRGRCQAARQRALDRQGQPNHALAGEALLRDAVTAGANLIVAGGTGAGKTTLLNAMGAWFAPHERVVTIEETAELRLPGDHVVRLEARPANAEGAGAVSVRDLVRTALRMRPDRLVVGEVRGAEAIDMLQALNTGHAGSATTLHANGAVEALHRLESLAVLGGGELPLAAVRAQIAAAIDLVVVVGRGTGGARRVTRIAEVTMPGTRLGVIDRWSARRGLTDAPARRPVLRGEA